MKEEGECSLDAAIRELQEETDIDLAQIHTIIIQELPASKYKKQNKMLESFLVITDTDLSNKKLICHSLVNNQFPEIDQFKWAGIHELSKWLHESQIIQKEKIKTLIDTTDFNDK